MWELELSRIISIIYVYSYNITYLIKKCIIYFYVCLIHILYTYIVCLVYTLGTFEHTLCRIKLAAAKTYGVKIYVRMYNILYYILCPRVLKITRFREIFFFFRKKTNGEEKFNRKRARIPTSISVSTRRVLLICFLSLD